MKRIFYILLFVLSFLFYWGTGHGIENRTEAEDVYEYALMVEQGADHPWFYHEHHLLYAPMMKAGYVAMKTLGYEGRAILVMRLLSALSAAGTLFFFFLFCYKRYSLRPVSSLLATAFMGLSYGFWRYSAESEIPLIASFFVTAALYFSTDEDARKRTFVLSIIFSVLAVMMHLMNVVAVLVAIPAFYLVRRRVKAMGVHVLLCLLLISGIYFLTAQFAHVHGSGGARLSMVGLGSLVKACVAFVQCLISSEFMLGFKSVRAFLAELFAGRMLQEEFYLGSRLPRLHVLFALFTYCSFFILFFFCIGRAAWLWKNIAENRKQYSLPRGLIALVSPALFFLGYGVLLLFIEPGNPELWIMGLIPFALFFCGVVLLPLTVDNRLWLPFLMVVVLFIHNAEAIRMLHDPEKDYQRQKTAPMLEFVDESDLIVTAGNPVFERYLRYHVKGEVLYLYNLTNAELAEGHLPEVDGQIYVLGDVFEQPKSLTVRFPQRSKEIEVFAHGIKDRVSPVYSDEFGGVYRLETNSLGVKY